MFIGGKMNNSNFDCLGMIFVNTEDIVSQVEMRNVYGNNGRLNKNKVQYIDNYECLIKILTDIIYNTVYMKLRYTDIIQAFENQYLLPNLHNTYLKIKKQTINYFSENPFIDAFYASLLSFIKSNLCIDYMNFIKRELKGIIKKYKFILKNEVTKDPTKFNLSSMIDVKKDVQFNINIPITKKCAFISFDRNLSNEELNFVIIHAMVSYIKNIIVNNVKCCREDPYNRDASIDEFYNIMQIDHCGFFMRNVQSLTEYYGRYKVLHSDLPTKMLTTAITTIIDSTKENSTLENMSSLESTILAPLWSIKGLAESMNRPSNNELANMQFDVDRCERYFNNLLDVHPENPTILTPKFYRRMYTLIKDFKYKYLELGLKDEKLIENLMGKITNWVKSFKINSVYDTINITTDLRTTAIGKYLNSSKMIDKYGDHHSELIKDTDTFLGDLENVIREYVDFLNQILMQFDDWDDTICNKIKTYSSYNLEDSIRREFEQRFNGFSVKIYNPSFITHLLF